MNEYLGQVSAAARGAIARRQWPAVHACAREILKHDADSAEGYFLTGLVEKAARRAPEAIAAFSRAVDLDRQRYDAAIELASQYCVAQRNGEAAALVSNYEPYLENSPVYLKMAGNVYSGIGMPEKALSLFRQADKLQPGVDVLQASIANSSVFVGEIDEATRIYRELLDRHPQHQGNHYQLSRLRTATDRTHIDEMKSILERTQLPPGKNVYMYYAIGKELEDIGAWDEAFDFFRRAGDAVMSVADYDIDDDLCLIDTIIERCTAEWLNEAVPQSAGDKTPIFLVGLPRSGTTLTERIIASHSQVQSVGETQFMQMVVRRESGVESEEKITPEMIRAGVDLDIAHIGQGYLDMLDYRLGSEPMFLDKLPFNILYLGFIAKAFPHAKLVIMKRNPMDSCFSMYKQVFAWAYKFSYSLENLARFYPAYVKLLTHWEQTLGDRLVEVRYEDLVADQEAQTRSLLDKLGLEFEDACLNFDRNSSATETASSVQVRQKVYTGSVQRWRKYERQLEPLRAKLAEQGIAVA